ncbi:MAG: MerR family transcriptional regulator [Bacillota bacterium]|nr:MerR family transcriptional regulator [Bacillota bacterium]
MLYTVGEMAKLLGIAPSALRYYDKEGLLPFLERSEGGKRIFKDSDYEGLQVIECLKKTGMQLKDIRDFIHMLMQGDDTIDDRLQLFLKRREEVKRQIADLQDTLDTIDFKCWYYETAKQSGTTALLENMKIEELPEQYQAVRKKLRRE